MNPLVHYEAVGDAAPVDAGDLVAEAAPVEAAPVDDAAAAVEAPADPFAGIDPADLRELTELAPILRQVLTAQNADPAAQQQPASEDGPPELDPFDPDSMSQRLAWERAQTLKSIEEMINPLRDRAQQEAIQEQQELLKDAAHDTEQRLGEFIDPDHSRQQMIAEARRLFPEVAARYGNTDRAAEIALERAHAEVAAREERIGKAYHDRRVNEAASITGARKEPGTGSAAVEAPGEYKDEMAALAGFLAKQNPTPV